MLKPNVLMSAIAILFSLTATAAAQESPVTVDGATTVDAHQAKALFDKGVVFVDVRTQELWEESHVPGAHFIELFSAFMTCSPLTQPV